LPSSDWELDNGLGHIMLPTTAILTAAGGATVHMTLSFIKVHTIYHKRDES
jgi:hypothetical protein